MYCKIELMREVVGWAVVQGPGISSLHLLMLEQFRPEIHVSVTVKLI